MTTLGWYMPGMRQLARARCEPCARDWFIDLPVGQGQFSPVALDASTGETVDPACVTWWSDWLRDAHRQRSDASPAFHIRQHHPATRQVVVLNCIDVLYGHALLKLFNVQRYLDAGQVDVVAIVQPCIAALVPDGVAETWVVDLPLRDGAMWSDRLARDFAAQMTRFPGVAFAAAQSHPHPSTFSIENFSRVRPFDPASWSELPPTLTFIWREDRLWLPGLPRFTARHHQTRAVIDLLTMLRRRLPALDVAVAGIGAPGGLPEWIADHRVPKPYAASDRDWLARYAESHVVVGVHGSNMILPSAHAGSCFELIGGDRSGNFLQDIVFNGSDPRDLFFRTRFMPIETSPAALAESIAFVIERYPQFRDLMPGPDVRH
ncbi:hypothetical protein [Glacieibacterium frigidum]|uniref:Glycosyltransferase n=1 Tax=Glacieibacterium frigidum TaxID=2593303 RepID=A0A552UG41_9SPHN|nr:hypothetical protein [Glacieibacterium frigidum]TRW17196.1 hypothetical protein FMM06_03070 [Glacieibacterium frigidum]